MPCLHPQPLHRQPVPTIDDARAVAEALMSFEQVCEVAVFGSVARAAARPDSDLDLLVVCDDIDYGAQRAALAVRMREIAASVVRWPLDLLVTDRAAWAAWTGLPSTSEAVIAEDRDHAAAAASDWTCVA